ncbi:MAG: hypothetical protein AAB834_07305 [Patescibacteria group bacterium]
MQKKTTIFRATSMLGAVSAVVVGATFALPPVSATLTNSSLTAASADLVVDGPDENATFGATDAGFTFDNLFPGAVNFSAPQNFALKNTGTTDLKIAVSSTGGSGTLDPTKVDLKFVHIGTGTEIVYTLADLDTAKDLPGVSGATDSLGGDEDPETAPAEGETNNFTLQVKLDDDAVNSRTGFNLVFTGTPVDETPAPTPEEGD